MAAYSTLWTCISFRLPQDTRAAKSAARKFVRKVKSLGAGFGFVTHKGQGAGLLCCRFDRAVAELEAALPADGELRLVPVTDKQVEKSRNLWGAMRRPATA